ncbi:MAG: hypothetical protein ACYTHJ_20290 [Planctomycetota bacterium]
MQRLIKRMLIAGLTLYGGGCSFDAWGSAIIDGALEGLTLGVQDQVFTLFTDTVGSLPGGDE